MPVTYVREGERVEVVTGDISRGGLFLLFADGASWQTPMALELHVPGEPPIRCEADIRFAGRAGTHTGVGVEFCEFAGGDRSRWEAYYDGALTAYLREQEAMSRARLVAVSHCVSLRLGDLLARDGCDVQYVDSHADIWSAVLAHDADAVVCEFSGAPESGLALCGRASADPALSHIQFILLSSGDVTRDLSVGLEAGAAYVITRQYRDELLFTRLQHVLSTGSGPRPVRRGAGDTRERRVHAASRAPRAADRLGVRRLAAPGPWSSRVQRVVDTAADLWFVTKLFYRYQRSRASDER